MWRGGDFLADFLWALIIALVVIFTLSFFLTAAEAHEWYDPECCSGEDCAPIAAKPWQVERIPGGYRIKLRQGDHPMVRRTIEVEIGDENPKLRQSHDEKWHVCVGPASQAVFCVYKPDAGF